MIIRYFRNTDTLYIEFRQADVMESRDLDEDTIIDLDAEGKVVAMTMEHAHRRTDIPNVIFEEVAA